MGEGKFTPLEFVPSVELPDDEYPFILTTGRLLEHWHGGTMTRNSKLDELYPQAEVGLHPADAALAGVRDQQMVEVASRRGAIILRAKVSEKTSAGVVFIPFHFAEAAANLLTIDALDPQAKIPEFKACAVKITPVAEKQLHQPDEPVTRGRY